MSARALVPEMLDYLPPDDPRAIHSRRDLARINWVMGQGAIMARALRSFPPPRILADLGSGDGRFLLGVAKRLAKCWPGVEAVILDQQNIVTRETQAGFARLGWRCEVLHGDIFQTLPQLSPDIVTANLFLHHFDDAALAGLLALAVQHARAFAACEPHRSAFSLLGAHLVAMLGANGVTRHDAVASVRAGFRDQELTALWPKDGRWSRREGAVFPFTQLFCAQVVKPENAL